MVVKYCPSTSDGVTTNYGVNTDFSCDDYIRRIRSQNIATTGQIPEGSSHDDTPSIKQQKERHQKKDPFRDEIPCVGLHRFAHFKKIGNNRHTHKQRELYTARDVSLIRRVTIGKKRRYPVGFSDCTAFPKLRFDFSSFFGDTCKRALPKLLHWPPNDLDSLGLSTLLDFKQIAYQTGGGRVAPTTTVIRARSENSLNSIIVATSSVGRSSSARKASSFSIFLPSSASSTDVTVYDDLGRFLKLDVSSNILHVSVSLSSSLFSSTTTTTTPSLLTLLLLVLLLLLFVEDNFRKSTLIDVGDSESDLRHRQWEKLLLFIRAGVLDSDASLLLLLQLLLLLLLSLLSVYSARNMEQQKITPKMNASIRSRPIRRTNSMKMSGRIRIAPTTSTSTSSSNNNSNNNNNNNNNNSNIRRNLASISDHSTPRLESGCRCTYTTDNTVSSDASNSHQESNPFLTAPSEFWPVYNCSTPYNNHLRARTCNNTINNNDDCNNTNNSVQIVNNRRIILSKSKPTPPTTTTITDFGTTQENSPTNPKRVVRFFIYLTYMWWSLLTRLHSCTGPLDTCHRSGSSTGSSTRKQGKYVLLTINMLALFTCAAGQCKVSTCQTQWPSYQMNSMDVDLQSDSYKCRALRTTLHCIRKVSHGCVGNIDYHSEKSRIQKQMSRSKCSTIGDIYETVDHTHRPQVQRPQPECLYKGKGSYKHCGLFGDPHLRTFNRVCQTCKIRGAWPLVDNNRLTVMVTNKPVMVDGTATATVMLTVRIRRNELCGSHHFVTYETQANHLPSTFDDGRTHYGPGNGIELKVLEPNKHIKIHIKYIDTTILIRQIGRYFTFALWMPEEMVDESNGNTPELCVRGCPKSEQINYQEFLAQKHQQLMEYKTQNKLVMGRLEAETLCRQSKVVDFYFDSCVFDLMTTGDRNFTVAAYSALHDLLKLNPEVAKSNKNRTDFQRYDQRFSGSTSTRTLQILQKLTLVFMTLFSSSVCSSL